MKNLTDRQREVLIFIAQFTEDNVFPPTVREIGEHFGISLRAVQDHVAALQKKGYLSQSQKRSRSIRVLKDVRPKVTAASAVLV
ncbi:MAG: repressor LexA, partial [Treponema sp.]|nr:repressor LexA [Treponema sp.]